MTPQDILKNIAPGTEVRNWSGVVPLGHKDFWHMPTFLEVLARLSHHWQRTKQGWLKHDPDTIYYEWIYGYESSKVIS